MMPACQKCWTDAGYAAHSRGGSKAEHYERLIDEREDDPCTAKEQCGEMHLVVGWKDGTRHCVCGQVAKVQTP